MKHATFFLFGILNCMAGQAQFNTIGSYHNCMVSKIHESRHSEQYDAPKDSFRMVSDSLPVSADSLGKDYEYLVRQYFSVAFPVKVVRINSNFGFRMHPVYHKRMMHNGIDLHARHEDILSMFPGRVIRVGYDGRSGRYVTVQSADYTVSYCHLSQQYVKVDDVVGAGDALGMSGSTGAASGEHLHLTTKKDGKAIDPAILLDYVRKVKDRCIELLHRR